MGSGVDVDIVWGFGYVVVGVVFVAMHGGRWWDTGHGVIIQLQWWVGY
jgi:hypothetical protein